MGTEVVEQPVILHAQEAKPENLTVAYVLSTVVAVLAAMVSAIGLLFPTVYGSKGWDNATSLGNDSVTLVVAVPVLTLGLIYSAHGSVRARLLWLGALYYMVYNYAFYVFGMPVTKVYVPTIAIFALSGMALLYGLFHIDVEAIGRQFGARTPARWIAAFLFYVAVMISFLWISQWVKFFWTGRVPEVNGSASAYQVIAAVDLSFMVSLWFPAAVLLWRRRAWGFVLSTAALVQGATYTAVMAMVCVFGWILKPGSQLISGWFINCLVGSTVSLICLAGLLGSVKTASGK